MRDYEVFAAAEVTLQSGVTLPKIELAYKTYGELSSSRDNVIVYPTWFCGRHTGNEWLIGDHLALDARKYFIVVPNMLGNGLSSSPSHMPPPFAGRNFPKVTVHDNVLLQHRLVTERFGVDRIALAVGWSMGAQQVYEWASFFPDMVERVAPLCGSAKTSRHNFVFLEGVKAALTADAAFNGGDYASAPKVGLAAMSRVYAGWALSQAFYREELDLKALGFPSIEAFFIGFWEGLFGGVDANDILAMLATWQAADISRNAKYGGDFKLALANIKARALVMPCATDLYFPPEDSRLEVAAMPGAELDVIPSIWGHAAGAGLHPPDIEYIDAALKRLLADR